MIFRVLYWELVIENVIEGDCFIFEGARELWPFVNNLNFKSVGCAERLSILKLDCDIVLHNISDASCIYLKIYASNRDERWSCDNTHCAWLGFRVLECRECILCNDAKTGLYPHWCWLRKDWRVVFNCQGEWVHLTVR